MLSHVWTALAGLSLLVCAATLPHLATAGERGWTVLEYGEDGSAVRSRQSDPTENDKPIGFADPNSRAVESDQVLVVDPTEEDLTQLSTAGFRVIVKNRLDGLGMTLVELTIPHDYDLAEALQVLARDFPNLIVGANDLLDMSSGAQVAQASGPTDFTRSLSGWGEVPESCGQGIVLGQIDGFVDTDHPALRGKRLVYGSFIKEGRLPAAGDHGTAVAIMLIGRSVEGLPGGLLPGARLYAANIFERRDGREAGNLAALVRAIDWLVQNHVKVANLSIAGHDNVIMQIALKRSIEKGLLLVAAAGNNGPYAPPVWPAAHPDVFAVTAVDSNLHQYRNANNGDYIDFAAPGVNVPTQTPHGPMAQSGTSFAVPFVTAMVALHLQIGFEAKADLIRRSLQRYSTDLGSAGKDANFGWGLVRLRPKC